MYMMYTACQSWVVEEQVSMSHFLPESDEKSESTLSGLCVFKNGAGARTSLV